MKNNIDRQYLELCNHILKFGTQKKTRNGEVLSIYGWQIRHRMSEGFPLITTKKMAWKTMVTELLWFLRGDTNIKYLLDNDCYIWDGDAYQSYLKHTLTGVNVGLDKAKGYLDNCLVEFEGYYEHFTNPAFKYGYRPLTQEEFINKIKTNDEFAKKFGELGPIYGAGWRRWKAHSSSNVPVTRPVPNLREGVERTYLGVANGRGKEGHILAKTWEGMISRCYDPKSIEYPNYGACNVYVCDRWLEFKAFAEDAEKLPNWSLKKENPRDYVLDKDGIGTGYCYSLENCQWITPTENANLKSNKKYTVEKNGVHYTFSNPTSFCREHGISDKNFSDLWTGKKNAKKRNGFTLVSVTENTKPDTIDQIADVINLLKTDPDSRRMIVSAWAVHDLQDMVLPPCHMMFQFYTRELSHEERYQEHWKKFKDRCTADCYTKEDFDNKNIPTRAISLMWYQRSCDVPLGLPFNLASYGLLLEIVAKEVNMVPEDLTCTIGDAHIYNNQVDGIKEQMERIPFQLPTLKIKRNMFEFGKPDPHKLELDYYSHYNFELENYQSHPAIKLPLSN